MRSKKKAEMDHVRLKGMEGNDLECYSKCPQGDVNIETMAIYKIWLWLLHGEWTARVSGVGSGELSWEAPAGDDNGFCWG